MENNSNSEEEKSKNQNDDNLSDQIPTQEDFDVEAGNLSTETPIDNPTITQNTVKTQNTTELKTSYTITHINENKNDKSKSSDQTYKQDPNTDKPKKSKKKLIIFMIILLLIIGGIAAWFFLGSKKAEAPQGNSNQNNQKTAQTETQELKPYALAYSYQTEETDFTPDCSPPPAQQAYLNPIDGSEKIKSTEFGNVIIGDTSLDKQKVVVVSYSGCDVTGGQLLWFSQNSGKSYDKIYSAKKPESSESLGEQITSVAISSDGKSVVFALLESSGNKNTVKEVNTETKVVKDLFIIEQRGVFIRGYDKANNKIYYFVGCYNCGGNNFNKLYVRNAESDKEEVVFEHNRIGYQTVFNNDFSKILVNKASQGDGIGGGPPYDIEEFDMETKVFKNLETINEKDVVIIGYTEKQEPYYTSQNKIVKKVEDGTKITVYNSPKTILDVLLVSEDQVIISEGEYNNFEINNYNVKDKNTTLIVKGDEKTKTFGITWK
jgi:cytoskeletal protein RodZ